MRLASVPLIGPCAAAPSSEPAAADAASAPELCAPTVDPAAGASDFLGLPWQPISAKDAATIKISIVRRIQSLPFTAAYGLSFHCWAKGPQTGSRTSPRSDFKR